MTPDTTTLATTPHAHATNPPLRAGSLFSGAGSLDLAVNTLLGTVTVWHAENDPAAATVLATHWPGVPNLGDITTVDWTAVPRVDVLTGGFPCQDLSAAGHRTGLTPHTRSGLWSHMATAITTLRPRLVIIENVRGLLHAPATPHPTTTGTDTPTGSPTGTDTPTGSPTGTGTGGGAGGVVEPCPWCLGTPPNPALRALGAVLGELATLGYDTAWCGLPATTVGAPHHRFRVFLTAWPTTDHGAPTATNPPGPRGRPPGNPTPPTCSLITARGDARRDRGAPTTDPESLRREQRRPGATGQLRGPDPARPGHPPTQDWGRFTPAITRWEHHTGTPAPAPTMAGARGARVLNPAFSEWLMGWPPGWVTAIPRLTRAQQLRLIGNGVIPHQATTALTWLLTHTPTYKPHARKAA